MTYNANGSLLTLTEAAVTTTLTMDARNRLVAAEGPAGPQNIGIPWRLAPKLGSPHLGRLVPHAQVLVQGPMDRLHGADHSWRG